MRSSALQVCFLLCMFAELHGVNVPPNPCPRNLEYKRDKSGQFFGKIIIPMPSAIIFEVNVRFSVEGPVPNKYTFMLEDYYDDRSNDDANTSGGNNTIYRINFPTLDVLPRLTRLAVDDVEICLARGCECANIDVVRGQDFGSQKLIQFTPTSQFCDVCKTPEFSVRRSQQLQQEQRERKQQKQQQQHLTSDLSTRNISKVCGRIGSADTSFISGNRALKRGQFPWLTAIYKKLIDGFIVVCGGALISSRTLIASAHCFVPASLIADQIFVTPGRFHLNDYSEEGVVVREIQTLLNHPEYEVGEPDTDLALLLMKAPVSFSEHIQPICLWNAFEEVANSTINAETGIIIGWDTDVHGHVNMSVPKISIIHNFHCGKSLDSPYETNANHTICVGTPNEITSFYSNSGSGLMIRHNERWMLRGLMTACEDQEIECYIDDETIYTDVMESIDWIQENMLN